MRNFALIERGRFADAALYAGGSVLGSLLLLALGWWAAREAVAA